MQSAWVKEQQVSIEGGEIAGSCVNRMITFVMENDGDLDDDDLDEDDEEA